MPIAAKDANGSALNLASTTTDAGEVPGSTPVDPSTGTPFKAASDAQLVALLAKLPTLVGGLTPTQLSALLYTVSSANVSTTQLAAGASFTGTIETVQNSQAAQVSVTCDQAYTVQILQFLDAGGTRALPVVTFTRAANAALNENVSLFGDFFQVVVTNNGGSTTTNFQCGVTFGLMNTQPASLTNDGKFPTEAGVPPALATTYNVAGVIAINTVLQTLDCSQYRGVSIQCTSMGTTGVVTPEWSNNNTNWQAATMLTQAGATATTFNAAGLWVLPVMARYLRLRLSTATTAGTTTIVSHQFNDRAQMWLATQPVSLATNTPTLAAGTNRVGFVAGAGIWFDDSSTTLAANATFTGTSRDATVTATATAMANAASYAKEVRLSAESDVTGTLWLEVSRDNTNWRRVKSVATAAVTGGGFYAEIVHLPSWRYWRSGYTNGATIQARFSINSLAMAA